MLWLWYISSLAAAIFLAASLGHRQSATATGGWRLGGIMPMPMLIAAHDVVLG